MTALQSTISETEQILDSPSVLETSSVASSMSGHSVSSSQLGSTPDLLKIIESQQKQLEESQRTMQQFSLTLVDLGRNVTLLKAENNELRASVEQLTGKVEEQQSKIQTLAPNFNEIFENPVYVEFSGVLHQGLINQFRSLELGKEGMIELGFNPWTSAAIKTAGIFAPPGVKEALETVHTRFQWKQLYNGVLYLHGSADIAPKLALGLSLAITRNPQVQSELNEISKTSKTKQEIATRKREAGMRTVQNIAAPNVYHSSAVSSLANNYSSRIVSRMINETVDLSKIKTDESRLEYLTELALTSSSSSSSSGAKTSNDLSRIYNTVNTRALEALTLEVSVGWFGMF